MADAARVCQSCLGDPSPEISCVSVDCPVLYQRIKAHLEAESAADFYETMRSMAVRAASPPPPPPGNVHEEEGDEQGAYYRLVELLGEGEAAADAEIADESELRYDF